MVQIRIPFNIPLFDYLEIKERLRDPRIDEKLTKDITEGLVEKLQETVTREQSLDLQIWSRKGKGKSTLALKIMEERYKIKYGKDYDPEAHFDLSTIHFTTDSLEAHFRDNTEKIRDTCILLDEQVATWGVGSYVSLQKLATYSETLRKRRVNFFFASPSARYMNTFQYDFMLQPLALTQTTEQHGTVLLSAVFTRNNDMLGTIFTSLPSKYVMKEYEKKKEAALDMFTLLNLNEADKYERVVDSMIEKYNMEKWYENIKLWKLSDAKLRKELQRPADLSKSRIISLMQLEPHKYATTECDIISDLILLKLQGILTKEGLNEQEELGTNSDEDRNNEAE